MDNRVIVPANGHTQGEQMDDGLRAFAQKLRTLLPNGEKMTDTEALAGANYAKVTGLDPFRGEFYIVPGVGVVPGYKGIYTRQSQQGREPDYRYRPLTDEEREWHDIMPGDKAVICYATEPAEAAEARKEGREPRTWEGFGVVRWHEQWVSFEWRTAQSGKRYKAKIEEAAWKERADPPAGRSWGWVAKNRAQKDCANHMGIPVDLDAYDVLAQAEAADIRVEVPDGANLTAEQAQLLVAESLRAHAAEVAPPDSWEQQARSAAHVTAMRGPKTDDPFGIDTPPRLAPESPGNGNAPTDAESAAAFDDLPSASAAHRGVQASAPADNRIAPAVVDADVFGDFMTWTRKFAGEFTHYQDRGQPDLPHIKRSIAKIGHAKVSRHNFEQIQMELADRALAAEAAAKQ